MLAGTVGLVLAIQQLGPIGTATAATVVQQHHRRHRRRASASGQATLKKGELRWSVKTGSDVHATEVNMAPQDVTPAELTSFPRPDQFPASLRPLHGKFDDVRFAPHELQVYRVKATITAFKVEKDGDFHMAMEGEDGTPFVAEIVKPSFATSRQGARSSIWLDQIRSVRNDFLAHFGLSEPPSPGSRFTDANDAVTITGVAYFDDDENQRNKAANVIEIHPVLTIAFEQATPRGAIELSQLTNAVGPNIKVIYDEAQSGEHAFEVIRSEGESGWRFLTQPPTDFRYYFFVEDPTARNYEYRMEIPGANATAIKNTFTTMLATGWEFISMPVLQTHPDLVQGRLIFRRHK